jgi:hypothetical protein
MVTLFCLRLATGMIVCLWLLTIIPPANLVNPRYYRTHFLTCFFLLALAWFFAPLPVRWPDRLVVFVLPIVLSLVSSVIWWLQDAPGGRVLVGLTAAVLIIALGAYNDVPKTPPSEHQVQMAGNLTSALLLGAAVSAMLMGHSYLIAPAMSLTPLMRLLALLAIGLAFRAAVEGGRLWWWTRTHALVNLEGDTLLWLPVRWVVGLVLPAVLGWMAWQSARIRSTQSATGILYVVVVLCFVGELLSLLLRSDGVTL